MRARWVAAAAGAVLVAATPAPGEATIYDANFAETVWAAAPELANATGLAFAPDGSGRLFLIRQYGEIRIIKGGMLLPAPFATVSPIHAGGELGLLGIAFDPNFAVTGHVYVFATVSSSEQQIIRYTADGDLGTAKTTVVPRLPTQGINHNAGGVGIGPDGKLYWAVGDLGTGIGVNDDLTSLAAKIGRANLDGTPVADNPFFDGAGPNPDHIWARGFRNPFTLTFQPATGLLWVNVVGSAYEQIFIVRRGDNAGYYTYENNQPQGFITPVVKYRTNGISRLSFAPAAMSGAVRANGTVTFTVTAPHDLRPGEKVIVYDVEDPSFNIDYYVSGIPSPTSFTALTTVTPDAVSGGGSGQTLAIGGCITGGAFYDATGFPAAHRGNFFFVDYNTGRMERVTLDPTTNAVTSVDHFGEGIPGAVDVALGPDGALYYTGTASSGVYRAAYRASTQGLVVSPTNVWTTEGEAAKVMVSLAMSPTDTATVSVARSAGDADVDVAAGGTLVFTAANWNVPQPVTVAARRDLDGDGDQAMLSVASAGLPPQTVTVRARDDNALTLRVSVPTLAIGEGASGTFTVALSAQPSLDVDVTVGRASGDGDVAVTAGATLRFTSGDWSTPREVTVAAAHDADGSDDRATITVTAAGMEGRTVEIAARDDDATAPAITSTPVSAVVAGAAYAYDVEATGLPPPAFTLVTAPAGMVIDAVTGAVTWRPGAPGSFPVAVRAANGVAPDAVQEFGVEVAPDAPPQCTLTSPRPGDVVSGGAAAFSAEGTDDVGTVKAEFHVDGLLVYTHVGTSGRYHYRGTPMQWDTTALADGSHAVRATVFDTTGQTCFREATVTTRNRVAPTDAGSAADGPGTDATGDGAGATEGGALDGRETTASNGSGCGCAAGGRSRDGWQGGALALALVLLILVSTMKTRRSKRKIALGPFAVAVGFAVVSAATLASGGGCVLFAPSEAEIKAEFDSYVAGANRCDVATDCALAFPGCPLGCFVAVRADRKADVEQKARELVDDYERGGRRCVYDCNTAGELTCTSNRCTASSQ
jgi:MYXO-CTERM domain-containing protein